jgi:hypothetical protein
MPDAWIPLRPASLAAFALLLGCPPTTSTLDDDGRDDDDVIEADDEDAVDDDDAATDCWQAETILDLTGAPGPGVDGLMPELSATCDGDELVVTTNSIPFYSFIQMTPNALVENNQTYRFPLNPQLADAPSDIPLLGYAGVSVAGLPWFGPNEAGQPAAQAWGDPIYNGITDPCLGHTANEYHQHALAQKCLDADNITAEPWTAADPDPTQPSPVIGWAADGFPIYGPYGCLDKACTEVVEFQSGWVQTAAPVQDAWDNHEYVASADDTVLDQCNGRIGPDGTYRYHATATFPYILGCYAGEVDGNTNPDPGDDDDDVPPDLVTCDDPDDCVGECPAGSLGCTCAPSMDPTVNICVPTCEVDEDCPAGGPTGVLVCDDNAGICRPGM